MFQVAYVESLLERKHWRQANDVKVDHVFELHHLFPLTGKQHVRILLESKALHLFISKIQDTRKSKWFSQMYLWCSSVLLLFIFTQVANQGHVIQLRKLKTNVRRINFGRSGDA